MGLVIASIGIPLSVYESLENQVNRWLQETGADDFSLGLFSPKLMEQLRKTQVSEIGIFAPKGEIFVADAAEENSAMLYNFSEERITALWELPAVEEIYWFRSYSSCDFYWNGSSAPQQIYLVSPGFLGVATPQAAYGRLFSAADPPSVAVLGYSSALRLFGSAEAAIGQTITTNQHTGKDCQRTLAVIGVLAPFTEENNPNAAWIETGVFVPDREPLDEVVFLPGGKPILFPVNTLFVSPKPGRQTEAISQIRNYFQQESGDRVYLGINTQREYYRLFGGIQARLAYLPFIGSIVGLLALVAVTNLGIILYARLEKKRYEFGVRRSLGASRSQVVDEYLVSIRKLFLARFANKPCEQRPASFLIFCTSAWQYFGALPTN